MTNYKTFGMAESAGVNCIMSEENMMRWYGYERLAKYIKCDSPDVMGIWRHIVGNKCGTVCQGKSGGGMRSGRS